MASHPEFVDSIEMFRSQQASKQPEAQLTRVIFWGYLPETKKNQGGSRKNLKSRKKV